MGEDLVVQVLSSDNNHLEPKLPEAMPESSQKTELPNSNSSEPRILGTSSLYYVMRIVLSDHQLLFFLAANNWIKNFNLFFETVMEVKRTDLNGSISMALRKLSQFNF